MALHPAHEFDRPLTHCPLCRSAGIAEYDHDFRGVYIWRCHDCRLMFMNPQYTDASLGQFYAHYIPERFEADSHENHHRVLSKTDDLKAIARFQPPGRWLSIGCGDGLELELAREQGWSVEGYDVDAATTARVAHRIQARVHSGNFFALGLPADSYDCVYMDQVLEHPKNPQDYLVEVRRILRPGGVLFIGCPNIRSLSNSLKTILGRAGLKTRRRGNHYGAFHHLFYYSPRVLRRILETHYGFHVLAAEGTPLNGPKQHLVVPSIRWRFSVWLRTRVPALESTFRLVCRKGEDPLGCQIGPRRAA
jgi:SAM-dependent methyltransferase